MAEPVDITLPSGEAATVPEGDLQQALDAGAKRARDPEQERLGGVGGQAASAIVGAARGATFGLSDPLYIEGARALGGDKSAENVRRTINSLKDVNPNASIAGELGGAIIPMAFGAPPVEGAATAEGAVARFGQRALAAAPRALAEGAGIGVGQELSEDALGNHDVTAQKLVASAAKGAIFGLLLGAGTHGLVGGAGDLLARGAPEAESAVARGFSTYGAAAPAASEALEAGITKTETSSPFMTWLRGKMVDSAEEQAFKSTGAKIKDIQKLGATAEAQAERSQGIGRRLLDEGIVTGTSTQKQIAERLTAKVEEVGQELGTLRKGLDKAVARPSTEAIANRVQTEVLAPLERLPGTQTEANAVRQYMTDFMDKAGEAPSFETLHEFRRALDEKLNPKLWNKVPGSAPPAAVELGKIRNIIEGEYEQAGERAAKELGGSFLGEYKLAKQSYADLRTAEKILTKEVARGSSHRTWSLTDTIAAGAGFVGAGPVGLAAALGNKAIRTFGNQAAADVLNRASRLKVMQRAVATSDEKFASAAKAFAGGKKALPAAKVAESAAESKVSAQTVRDIRDAVSNRDALRAKVSAAIEPYTDTAPKVAQAMATTMMRAAAHLARVLPHEPEPMGLSFSPQAPRRLSDSDLAKAQRSIEGVNDLNAVTRGLASGRITREHVDALREVYPDLFEELKGQVRAEAIKLKPKMSTPQLVAMSVLFGEPMTAIMKPSNVRAMQATFTNGAADPTQGPTAGANAPKRPMANAGGTRVSGFDKIEGAA